MPGGASDRHGHGRSPAGGLRGPEGWVWPSEMSRGPDTCPSCHSPTLPPQAPKSPPHWLFSAWPSPPSSPLCPQDGMALPPPGPAACPPRTNGAAAGWLPGAWCYSTCVGGASPTVPTQGGKCRGRAGGAMATNEVWHGTSDAKSHLLLI